MSFRTFWAVAAGAVFVLVAAFPLLGLGVTAPADVPADSLGLGLETLGPVEGVGAGAGAGVACSALPAPRVVEMIDIQTGCPGPFAESIVALIVRLPLIGVAAISACIRKVPDGSMRRVI